MPYLVEKITTPQGQLLGVRISPKKAFILDNTEQKKSYLFGLLSIIGSQAPFFKKRDSFCLITIMDEEIATLLTFEPVLQTAIARYPFVKLQVKQTFEAVIKDLSTSKNAIWLSHIGNEDMAFTQNCEAIILDETFTRDELNKNTFPMLIQNLKRYCGKIIVNADTPCHRRTLACAGVWGCCGIYAPVPISKVQHLM